MTEVAHPAPVQDQGATTGSKSRWWVLAVICIAQLMVVLDATIVNIALPSAQQDIGFDDGDRQWVVTAYSLAFGGLLLVGGRMADRFGRERMLLVGVVGFALASALAGAANSFGMLIAGRAIQGLFGALLAPAALSTLTTTFTDPKERSKAFGIFGAIAGAGGALGLLIGGVLTEYLDWRWTLYVNIIFAAITVVASVKLIHVRPGNKSAHIDIPGAVVIVAGLVSIVYGLSYADEHSWTSWVTLTLLIVGVILVALFVLIERRVSHPLLPMRVVTDRFRGGAYLTVGFSAMGMFAVFLFVTYYLEGLKGFSPVKTGLAFLPMIAMLILCSTIGGSVLLPRVGPRPMIPVGLLLAGGGMAYLALALDIDSSYAGSVLPGLMIVGVGLGITFSAAMNTATFGARSEDAGVASAMVNTCQQIGGALGTALLNTLSANAMTNYLKDHRPSRTLQLEAAVHSYVVPFWGAAAIFAAAAVIGALVLRSGTLEAHRERAEAGQTGGATAITDDEEQRIAPAERSTNQQPVTATAGNAPVGMAEASEPTTAGVYGVVQQGTGRPLSGAHVTLADQAGHQVARTRSDHRGHYQFDLPDGGTFLMIVAAENVAPHASLVAVRDQAARHDVTLEGRSTVTGRVMRGDGEHGRGPVGEARVTLTDVSGEVVASTTTRNDGTYSFTGLAAGDYVLTAQSGPHRPQARMVEVPDSGAVAVDLALSAGGHVVGTVTAAHDGRTLDDASVSLVDASGQAVAHSVTGEDGRFRFDNIGAGDYTLTAAGYAPVTRQVSVENDRVSSVPVELSARPGPAPVRVP